jgi:hypothetical protein
MILESKSATGSIAEFLDDTSRVLFLNSFKRFTFNANIKTGIAFSILLENNSKTILHISYMSASLLFSSPNRSIVS